MVDLSDTKSRLLRVRKESFGIGYLAILVISLVVSWVGDTLRDRLFDREDFLFLAVAAVAVVSVLDVAGVYLGLSGRKRRSKN